MGNLISWFNPTKDISRAASYGYEYTDGISVKVFRKEKDPKDTLNTWDIDKYPGNSSKWKERGVFEEINTKVISIQQLERGSDRTIRAIRKISSYSPSKKSRFYLEFCTKSRTYLIEFALNSEGKKFCLKFYVGDKTKEVRERIVAEYDCVLHKDEENSKREERLKLRFGDIIESISIFHRLFIMYCSLHADWREGKCFNGYHFSLFIYQRARGNSDDLYDTFLREIEIDNKHIQCVSSVSRRNGGSTEIQEVSINDAPYFVKLFERKESAKESETTIDDATYAAKREMGYLLSVNHVNILKVLGWTVREREGRYACGFVTEYVKYEMDDVIEKYKPNLEKKLRIIIEIAGALRYLHGKGSVHSDVSHKNVLFKIEEVKKDDGKKETIFTPVVIDFGYSQPNNKWLQDCTVGGTPWYVAPETACVRKEPKTIFASDVYSFGVLMYYLMMDMTESKMIDVFYPIPERKKELETIEIFFEKNPKFKPEFPVFETVSESEKKIFEVIDHCLEIDPYERPEMANVLMSLLSILRTLKK